MIALSNISKSYQLGKVKYEALNDIDLNIESGEMLAILGKSGSGKTTLLNIIGTLDKSDSGECVIDGVHIEKMNESKKAKYRNENIGFVMQDYSLINHKTVLFNVMLPMFFGNTRYSEMKKKAHKALQQVGLDDVYKKKANELSGGQRQRVAIARAIVNSPAYLLADEPTGALDSVTSSEIVSLLQDINKNGTTVIIVTHDDYVAENCKKIIRIHDGKIA